MASFELRRRVDKHGRVALPVEFRKKLGIENGEILNISIDREQMFLAKYESTCCICDSTVNIRTFRNKCVCAPCLGAIRMLFTPE